MNRVRANISVGLPYRILEVLAFLGGSSVSTVIAWVSFFALCSDWEGLIFFAPKARLIGGVYIRLCTWCAALWSGKRMTAAIGTCTHHNLRQASTTTV